MDKRAGWMTVVAGLLVLMCLGVAYAWGVFLTPIVKETGWSRAQVSAAVSVLLLVFSVCMTLGGMLERRIGAAKTVALGGVLVGLGWLLASLARSPWTLYASYGVLAGVGTGLGYMPSVSNGVKWFPERKGLVTGIIVFGFGFGTAFLSPVLTALVHRFGWRLTMRMAGLVFALVVVVASTLMRTPPAAAAGAASAGRDFPPQEAVRTSTFWVLVLSYFASMVAGMLTIGHLVAFLKDKGFDAMRSALALTVLAVFNGVGRVVSGGLADRLGGKRIVVVLFVLMAAAVAGLTRSASLETAYALAAVVGFCFGGFLAVYPTLTADAFGRRDFSINYGLVFVGYGLGCFAGPLLGGWIHDRTGSYGAAFLFAAGLAALTGLVLPFVLRKRAAV